MTTVPNFLDITINAVLCPTFIRKLYYKLSSIVTFTFTQIFDQNCVFFTEWRQSCRVCLIQVSGFKDEKFIKKQNYMKTETCKLYSRVS